MAAKGDTFYAWAADAACQERGECGGAVTALLTHALKSGMVEIGRAHV